MDRCGECSFIKYICVLKCFQNATFYVAYGDGQLSIAFHYITKSPVSEKPEKMSVTGPSCNIRNFGKNKLKKLQPQKEKVGTQNHPA